MNNVEDLQKFIANKDVVYKGLSDQLAALAPTWQTQDPAGYQKIVKDLTILSANYAQARASAEEALATRSSLIPDALINMDVPFEAIVRADQPVDKTVTPGDLQDISNRLEAFRQKATPNTPPAPVNIPFPVQQDIGSQFMANTVTLGAMGKGVMQAIEHPIDTVLGPQTPPDPNKKGWWEKKSFEEKVGTVAIGGVALLAIAKIYEMNKK